MDKIPFKAIEKDWNGLRKTVSKHIKQQISFNTSSHVTAVQPSFDVSYMTRKSFLAY